MLRTVLPVLLLAGPLACGGGAAAYRQYRDKCEAHCQLPATGCEGRDAGACVDRCAVTAEGLPALCGQCVAESSSFETQGSSGGQSACSLSIGRATGSTCAASCASTPATTVDPALLQVQCQLRCQRVTTLACPPSTSTDADCAKACVAAASGLPRLCAQCLVEDTGWEIVGAGPGPDGGPGPVSCSYSVGRSTSSTCRGFCTPDAG